jgi:hypothetical protein
MDRLLKRIQRVRPAAFFSQGFFLFHKNTRDQNLQVFANF